jgi:hypothetical protein
LHGQSTLFDWPLPASKYLRKTLVNVEIDAMIIEASSQGLFFIVFIYLSYLAGRSLVEGEFSNFQKIVNNIKGIMLLMNTK